MKIAITGTPGTGKTAVSAELAKMLHFPVIDVKEIVKLRKIYSKKKGEKELSVDAKKLAELLKKEIGKQKNLIIENHLICEFNLPVDYIFILRTEPEALKKRLGKRKYSYKKIEENILSEVLDYCSIKTRNRYGKKSKKIEIETAGLTPKQTARKILLAIKNKKESMDNVDYTSYLKNQLRLDQ